MSATMKKTGSILWGLMISMADNEKIKGLVSAADMMAMLLIELEKKLK